VSDNLPTVILVMGVCGCGKTTIGKLLADRLEGTFLDADDFHPQENINKMSQGEPLTDDARWPWLDEVACTVRKFKGSGPLILACSALKQSYRDRLGLRQSHIIFLHGTREIIRNRLSSRQEHFMPSRLLDSQLECLEEPRAAISISIDATPNDIIKQITSALREKRSNCG